MEHVRAMAEVAEIQPESDIRMSAGVTEVLKSGACEILTWAHRSRFDQLLLNEFPNCVAILFSTT